MAQSVNLVLKTTQINSDNTAATYFGNNVISLYGSVTNNRSSFTWNNINLRILLGDMYDKYERFNINLNFAAGGATGSTVESVADNRMFLVKLSGLPFTSSYNQPTNTNINQVVLTAIQLPLAATTTWYNNFFTTQYCTFTKQDIVNITIDLHTVATDTTYTTAVGRMIGHCVFSFNIYGVDEFVNKDITIHRNEIPYYGYNGTKTKF
jgi:hypothetical protein